ncbi:MAG: zinc ribbon domain-containing protein [Planctomycetes bacterium]|nr:zinc ribbon domain-containing protein [Planctomycetota bacterium]
MPTYMYECENEKCPSGGTFSVEQSIRDEKLENCPHCGGAVERLITGGYIRTPTSDSDLRDKGFAKLVRRDKGVYENVTALDGESKFWDANKPDSMPDIKRRISD